MTNKKVNNEKEKVIKIENGQNIAPKETKKNSNAYNFGKAFGERLRTDKFFLLSFLITLVFLGYISYQRLKNSQGSYYNSIKQMFNEEETGKDKNSTSNVAVDEELNVSDYVGVYSREITLTESIKLSNSCTLDSYKVVYQVKKDRSINKYVFNECFGVFKIWNGKLEYVFSGGTKYIGTKDYHFLFSGTSMKEVDGESYKIDEDIASLKEKNKIKDSEVYFYDNSMVFMNKTNLILFRGNSVLYNLNNSYKNNGGKLDKYIYKVDDYKYNFIIFNNGEELNCYEDSSDEDLLYKIYEITYDKEKMNFTSPKELISRNKKDGCTNWEEDFKTLKG